MNITIFTQNEDIYLKKNFDYLLQNLPKNIEIKAIFLCTVNPFGKNKSLLMKFIKTFKIFGFLFTLRYSLKYIVHKYFKENLINLFKKKSIQIYRVKNNFNEKNLKQIKTLNLDLIISLSCPFKIDEKILNIPRKGSINVHCSLLPKYRGLMPSFWALYHQEKYSGVSIFFMNTIIDDGPIIFQKKINISNMNLEELVIKSKNMSFVYLLSVLIDFRDDKIKIINDNPIGESTNFSFPKNRDIKKFKQFNKFY